MKYYDMSIFGRSDKPIGIDTVNNIDREVRNVLRKYGIELINVCLE